jgi:hypothetical protein
LESEGKRRLWVGPWSWPITVVSLPPISGDAHYVPLGGEMAFVGFHSRPDRLNSGASASVSPRFLSLRPLLADYAISVGLRSEEQGWESKSDGVPALGAIPTLKWIRGWVVTDPHTLTVPLDTAGDAASITLSVYDAFTLRSLNVMDDRLAREGQGTYLRLNTVPIE